MEYGNKWKQVIVVRKDLNMSIGKTAAQVSHASMAFLSNTIRRFAIREDYGYSCQLVIKHDLFENWIDDIFTKVVLEVEDKQHLDKILARAKESGMFENRDYFIIKDSCLTELKPEEFEEGKGRTITCVGFKPMVSSSIDKITGDLKLMK